MPFIESTMMVMSGQTPTVATLEDTIIPSGSWVSSGSIPTLHFWPDTAQLVFTGGVPQATSLLGIFDIAMYGTIILENDRPVTTGGLYGNVSLLSEVPEGKGLYGEVTLFDHSLGFIGPVLTIAELFTMVTKDGITFRATSHSEDITYAGNVYTAVPMRRGAISTNSDLEIDKVEVEMGIIAITLGDREYSMLQVLDRGYLRDMQVRIVAVDYNDLSYEKFRFEGAVTDDIGYNSSTLSMKIGSNLDRLKEKFPKLVYSELCPHRLFGQYCTLNAANYLEGGSALFNTSTSKIYADIFLFSNHAQGYWVRGDLTVTDVDSEEYLVGRNILAHEDGYVELFIPYSTALEVGVTFNAYPGCDKSGTECADTFNNYENFLGFEYIPKPEVMMG